MGCFSISSHKLKDSPDFLGHYYLSQVEKEMTNMDLMMKTCCKEILYG